MLIAGLSPIIIFIVCQLVSITFSGFWYPDFGLLAPMAALTSIFVVVLTFPTKVYGGITDRRSGSDWLMIPASTFEKWLSMVLITCVVLPLCLSLLLLGSDALLSLAFPHHYGDSLIHNLKLLRTGFLTYTDGALDVSFTAAIFLNWCEYILLFTLGAVVFKKSKAAKTMLCFLLLTIIVGDISLFVLSGANPRLTGWLEMEAPDPDNLEQFVSRINILVSVLYFVIFTALLGGLYCRLRTIRL